MSLLIVDEEELNEGLLAGILDRYIRIGKDKGDIYPKAEFGTLDAKQKSALILLAQHARYKLELADTDWLGPAQISDLSGVKRGTVYPSVRELDDLNLVESDDGEYRVPPPKLLSVQEFIEEGATS